MPQIDVETDPFLKLLTDALRAGPGSPQWHEAVAKLRSGETGAADADASEYQMLLRAREDLASGRRYREVRAGAGFTHRLLTGLEKEQTGGARRSFPTATIIALLAGIAVLAVLAFAGWKLMSGGEPNRGAIDDLAGTYFPNESNTLIDKSAPPGWQMVGKLPLEFSGGMRAATGTDLAGGGIISEAPIPASQSFAFEADLRSPHPSDAIVAQVFISTSDDFSPDRATSSRELVWQLVGPDQQVALNGNTEPPAPAPTSAVLRIRLTMSRDLAVVEANGKRIWAGSHQLGDAPRFPGVRFIRKSAGEGGPVVQSLKVLK
jgi:hypothetical protein